LASPSWLHIGGNLLWTNKLMVVHNL
jgi:hypothetical protein